jgi:hypothetical protein
MPSVAESVLGAHLYETFLIQQHKKVSVPGCGADECMNAVPSDGSASVSFSNTRVFSCSMVRMGWNWAECCVCWGMVCLNLSSNLVFN